MSIPIFNGFLYTAQSSEANYRAKAAAENTRDLRNSVVRDVRTAWLSANTAFQRVGVAAELAKEADLSLSLANSRYQLGLGSIVELSQAQLQQADAAIGYVNANINIAWRFRLSTLKLECSPEGTGRDGSGVLDAAEEGVRMRPSRRVLASLDLPDGIEQGAVDPLHDGHGAPSPFRVVRLSPALLLGCAGAPVPSITFTFVSTTPCCACESCDNGSTVTAITSVAAQAQTSLEVFIFTCSYKLKDAQTAAAFEHDSIISPWLENYVCLR
jgi:hypothetical protein